MKSFLKSSRKAGSKKYLGVIGNNLIEIIDEEPIIKDLLAGTRFSFTPSSASRYSGVNKRMILTTIGHEALIIFNTTHEDTFNDQVTLSVFINKSQISSAKLLKESEKLAIFRWPVITLFFESSSENEQQLFIQAGWSISADRAGNFTLEKTLVVR